MTLVERLRAEAVYAKTAKFVRLETLLTNAAEALSGYARLSEQWREKAKQRIPADRTELYIGRARRVGEGYTYEKCAAALDDVLAVALRDQKETQVQEKTGDTRVGERQSNLPTSGSTASHD